MPLRMVNGVVVNANRWTNRPSGSMSWELMVVKRMGCHAMRWCYRDAGAPDYHKLLTHVSRSIVKTKTTEESESLKRDAPYRCLQLWFAFNLKSCGALKSFSLYNFLLQQKKEQRRAGKSFDVQSPVNSVWFSLVLCLTSPFFFALKIKHNCFLVFFPFLVAFCWLFFWPASLAYKLAAFAFLVESKTVFSSHRRQSSVSFY